MDFVNKLEHLNHNFSRIRIILIFFIILLCIDLYISTVTDVVFDYIQTPSGIGLFFILLISSIVGSFLIVRNTLSISERKKAIFRKYKILLWMVQATIYSLTAVMVFSIVIENRYYTINLASIMVVSYVTTIIMSIFFSYKLLKWFTENKSKFALMFGLSIFFLLINNIISILLFATLLSEKTVEIINTTPVVFNFDCNDDSYYCMFKQNIINLQSYTLIIYFSLFWICNCFLLHYHIKKIGKPRFIMLVTFPLIFFFFAFIYHYEELYSLSENLNFDDTLVFLIQIFITVISLISCGLLYGFGFKSVANLLKLSPKIERYLRMASYGIVLLFISANATIVGASFPPFGIPSIIFLPFASLLLYVGIYYSIIAISNDIKVRKYIKNSAYRELEMIGTLAQSQMTNSMKEKVLDMTKKYSMQLHQSNNTETMESEEDLKSYLDEAINIFHKRRK